MDEIKIAYDMKDIDKKSESEKLNLLLKIAFANHTTLVNHGKILFGNGKQGLCDKVRFSAIAITGLWTVFVLAIVGFGSVLFHHVSK